MKNLHYLLVVLFAGMMFVSCEKSKKNNGNPITSEFWVSVDNLPVRNFKQDTVYVINNDGEYLQHPYFMLSSTYNVDFATQSILVNYFAGCMFCDVKSTFDNKNGYHWNVVYSANKDIMCVRAMDFMVYKIVPKIPTNTRIELNAVLVPCTDAKTVSE
ncbi:MAG: hypothetical protein LBN27_05770 [Prevotellaceae bacterium]|jgi:hypothetical protein|nr:hypothetical protein [Prevotellaceae bacterium]